jgi:uncharacterized protein (DUF433 family)
MPVVTNSHIEVDEKGVARIARSRMKVIHLVMDKMANNSTPDQMQQAFPGLSLGQIYSALAYYYDHKNELDAQIEQSMKNADAFRAQASPGPTRDELRRRLEKAPPSSGDSGAS